MARCGRCLCRFASTGVILALALLTSCTKSASADEAEVRSFLESYFSTWSVQEMDRYAGCFHPQARITYVAKNGETKTDGLTDFVHGQKLAHAQSPVPMSESPTEMKISFDSRVTVAVVRWKLTKGAEIVTGTNFFTLIKTGTGWKIMSLVFYND